MSNGREFLFLSGELDSDDRRLIRILVIAFVLYAVAMFVIYQPDKSGVREKSGATAPGKQVRVSLTLYQSNNSSTEKPVTKSFKKIRKVVPVIPKHKRLKVPVTEDTLQSSAADRTTQQTERAPVQATAPRTAAQVSRGELGGQQQHYQQYLSHLLNHIESFKYYPGAAKRRAITGTINVSFNLLAGGMISDLTIANGPSLLKRAARQAVIQAQPMPLPPHNFSLPYKVAFVMKYELI